MAFAQKQTAVAVRSAWVPHGTIAQSEPAFHRHAARLPVMRQYADAQSVVIDSITLALRPLTAPQDPTVSEEKQPRIEFLCEPVTSTPLSFVRTADEIRAQMLLHVKIDKCTRILQTHQDIDNLLLETESSHRVDIGAAVTANMRTGEVSVEFHVEPREHYISVPVSLAHLDVVEALFAQAWVSAYGIKFNRTASLTHV